VTPSVAARLRRAWGLLSWPHSSSRTFRANIRFGEKGSRCLKRSFLLVPCWAHPWRRSVLRLKEDAESVFTAARMEVAGRMGLSSAAITPAAAQDAKSLLQAADKAIGASAVSSVTYAGSGTMRYPGQSFGPNDDWPRAPMTSYTATIDYGSKSAKQDYMVDVAKKERGGGLA
jgi:hypothetical protein